MLYELIYMPFFQRALLALFLAGAACSVVGVWVLVMKFSFIGMCISHAAFAGALLALLLDMPVLLFSFIFSIICAGLLGPISDRGQLSPDASTGILFSVTLGLAFLFIGIMPEAMGAGLSLLWGSALTITAGDIKILGGVFILIMLYISFFYRETQSVIFSRDLAKASGIAASVFFYLILFIAGMTAAASLKTVGGLLVFSLMINPAAAAYQITYSLKKMYILAGLFGVISGWAGLFISTAFDLPVGASVILFSSLIFGLAAVFSPKNNGKQKKIF
jgi:manganese/iron transport system permease protein